MMDFINQHFSFILSVFYKILLAGGILFASSMLSRFIAV